MVPHVEPSRDLEPHLERSGREEHVVPQATNYRFSSLIFGLRRIEDISPFEYNKDIKVNCLFNTEVVSIKYYTVGLATKRH